MAQINPNDYPYWNKDLRDTLIGGINNLDRDTIVTTEVTWANNPENWRNAYPNRNYVLNGTGLALGYPLNYMIIRKITGYGSTQLILQGYAYNNASDSYILGAAYYNGTWNSGGWIKLAPTIISSTTYTTSKTVSVVPGKAYKFIIRGGNSIQEWLWLSNSMESAYMVGSYGSGLAVTCTADVTNKTLTFTAASTFILKGIEI